MVNFGTLQRLAWGRAGSCSNFMHDAEIDDGTNLISTYADPESMQRTQKLVPGYRSGPSMPSIGSKHELVAFDGAAAAS